MALPIRPALIAALALAPLLGGCATVVPETIYSPCHASGSGEWTARLERHHSPHPFWPISRHELIVSGTVTVPTGGFSVWLEEGPVQNIRPKTQQVMIRTDPPRGGATMAVVTHRVSSVFSVPRDIEEVAIRCGDGIVGLATVQRPPQPVN